MNNLTNWISHSVTVDLSHFGAFALGYIFAVISFVIGGWMANGSRWFRWFPKK